MNSVNIEKVLDINENRKLARSEESFGISNAEFSLEDLPGIIYKSECDSPRKILSISNYIMQVCGYDPSIIIYPNTEGLDCLIAEDDMDSVQVTMHNAKIDKVAYSIIYRVKHITGFFIQVHERGGYIYDDLGNAIYQQGFIAPTAANHFVSDTVKSGIYNNIGATQRVVNYRIVTQPNGEESFAYVHGSVRELFGVSELELMENSKLRFNSIHPDDQKDIERKIKESNQKNSPLLLEYRLLFNGADDPIWIRGSSLASRYPDGTIIRTGTAVDVTEVKKSEISLIQANNLLESIQMATSMLLSEDKREVVLPQILSIICKGLDTDIAYVYKWNHAEQNNKAALKCRYTFSKDMPILEGIYTSNSAISAYWYLDNMHSSLSSGQVIIQSKKQFKNIKLHAPYVRATLAVPIFKNQAYWGFIGFDECSLDREWTGNEIRTIRALANTLGNFFENISYKFTLQEHFAKLKATLESTVEGMAIFNKDGKLLNYNTQLTKIWNLSEDKLISLKGADLIRHIVGQIIESDRYIDELKSTFSHTLEESKGTLRLRNGNIIERYSAPLMVSNRFEGWVLSYRDITEQENFEKKLLQQNTELVKANKELDRFVYSASHELRAPLLSVLGLLSLVDRESLAESTGTILNKMKDCVLKLDELVQNIIHHSQYNRNTLKIQSVNLLRIIEQCLEHFQNYSGLRDLKINYDCSSHLSVMSDSYAISIILNNLISNAIKFKDDDKEESLLYITVEGLQTGINISLIDNGEGIISEHADKIFEMFFRSSPRGNGSGLGLYIVKELLGHINGTINVISQKGLGTTINVFIPNLPASDICK